MSENDKNTCNLNYVAHLLILASTVIGCVSISAFSSLVCVTAGITSSAVGVKIGVIIQNQIVILKIKVKVLLDLSNHATKKNYATGIDTSNVAAKKDFIALKAEVDKLDI